MQSAVKRLVIDIMHEFGVLECEYVEGTGVLFRFNRLDQVRLTPVGKGMLDLLG